jgi:glycosyltransferase involved in cell wall biosynthesis
VPNETIGSIAFVGFAIPDSILEKYIAREPFPPIQTHRFGWSLLAAIARGGSGWKVDAYSSVPISPFPHNPRWIVEWQRGNSEHCRTLTVLPFLNLPIARHITRCLSLGAALVHWVFNSDRVVRRIILLHGVASAHLAAARLAQWILGVRLVVVLTDPLSPSVCRDSRIHAFARRLDRRCLSWLLRGVSGAITLAPQLAEHVTPGAPVLQLDGILPEVFEGATPRTWGPPIVGASEPRFCVMYAGGLCDEYGVGTLIEAFARLPADRFILRVAGGGPMASRIQRITKSCKNIEYMGMLSADQLWQSMCSADLLVNPRPTGTHLARSSFPSKTLEYLATGTPVLSTRLDALSADYSDILLFAESDDVSGLALAIREAANAPVDRMKLLGDAGRAFVLQQRSAEAQGRRIAAFLAQLTT